MKTDYAWLAEALLAQEGALGKRFFGCDAVYIRGRLLLVLSDGEEPWNGAMFPVERINHEAVLARWGELGEHPILPKWLYLSATHERFELLARELVREIAHGNPLFGVTPEPKKGRKRKTSPKVASQAELPPTPNRRDCPYDEPQSIPPHLR